MNTVHVRLQGSYDPPAIGMAVRGLMETVDGGRIGPGARVLIKPNLLSPAGPQRAVLTHHSVVRAVVEYVLEKGGEPRIGDSPAMGSFAKILRESGIADALRDLPVICAPFASTVKVDVGRPFGRIDLAGEAVRADVIVNLPKLKTHGQMLLTLGVKNLFGCVVGLEKPQWHLRAGNDRMAFARLLVGIYEALQPACTILDGVVALEGDGPGRGGTPRPLGVLMAGRNAHAVDAVVCRLLGISPERLPTLEAARERGFNAGDLRIDGILPPVRGFRLPVQTPLIYGPRALHGVVRRYLLPRPVCDGDRCTSCGACIRICPAGAVTGAKRSLRFAYDACIRCYCCCEVCPEGAIRTVETLPGRLLRGVVFR